MVFALQCVQCFVVQSFSRYVLWYCSGISFSLLKVAVTLYIAIIYYSNVIVYMENPEMSQHLPENTKTGNFNLQRTLSGSFFVIPERLASIHAVVLEFTANKQTNKHSQLYI